MGLLGGDGPLPFAVGLDISAGIGELAFAARLAAEPETAAVAALPSP
ncbi:MAG TPA: hypothetical protein VIS09_02340 [Streptomyces sp.]